MSSFTCRQLANRSSELALHNRLPEPADHSKHLAKGWEGPYAVLYGSVCQRSKRTKSTDCNVSVPDATPERVASRLLQQTFWV